MKTVECEFCTPEAARSCRDATCRAHGYGYPPVFGPRFFDEPEFLAALTTAVVRIEHRDYSPELYLMAGGPDIAAEKADRILTELRAELTRRAGDA